MKRSHLFWMAPLFLSSLLLTACSSSKPEATVEAFYQVAAKRDVDKVMEQVAVGKLSDNELFQAKGKVQMMVGEFAQMIANKGGIKRIEVVESTVDEDGQNARVEVKLIFNDGSENTDTHRLIREDGKWKVIMF